MSITHYALPSRVLRAPNVSLEHITSSGSVAQSSHTVPSPLLTFLAKHTVTQHHLREGRVVAQRLAQDGTGVRGETMPTQVQPGGARACHAAGLVQMGQNRLLGLHAALLAQTQNRPSEVLHGPLYSLALAELCMYTLHKV